MVYVDKGNSQCATLEKDREQQKNGKILSGWKNLDKFVSQQIA